jgi:hypothetical protein
MSNRVAARLCLEHWIFAPRTALALPTSPLRISQEKWSDHLRDRNFNNAWGDSSPLELGRVMPNECWLRCEAPLMKSEADPYTVRLSSTDFGPMRRDPLGTFRARGDIKKGTRAATPLSYSRGPAHRHDSSSLSASAMGSSVTASRRSWLCGTRMRPVWPSASVAPFGVNAIPRLAHTNRALVASGDHTYEVQETDGVDPSKRRAPHATVGDGCPGVVLLKSAARSGQRGNG